MTLKQFRRMQVFAIRMVPQTINGGRWRKEVRGHVVELLCRLADPCYGCHWRHIINWDHTEEHSKAELQNRHFLDLYKGHLLCDFVTEYLWDNNLEREKGDRHGNCERVETKVGIAVACCIRAACDLAVSSSGGVLGFTVRDVREMWNGKVPKWVKEWFEGDFDSFKPEDAVWL